MRVARQLIDLLLWDADGTGSEINKPATPLNPGSKFRLFPTDRDLGDLAKIDNIVPINGMI